MLKGGRTREGGKKKTRRWIPERNGKKGKKGGEPGLMAESRKPMENNTLVQSAREEKGGGRNCVSLAKRGGGKEKHAGEVFHKGIEMGISIAKKKKKGMANFPLRRGGKGEDRCRGPNRKAFPFHIMKGKENRLDSSLRTGEKFARQFARRSPCVGKAKNFLQRGGGERKSCSYR